MKLGKLWGFFDASAADVFLEEATRAVQLMEEDPHRRNDFVQQMEALLRSSIYHSPCGEDEGSADQISVSSPSLPLSALESPSKEEEVVMGGGAAAVGAGRLWETSGQVYSQVHGTC